MKTFLLCISLLAFVTVASPLGADTVRLVGEQAPLQNDEIRITADCMKRVAWVGKTGEISQIGNRFPWEVSDYALGRGRKAGRQLEDAVNRAMRKGTTQAWVRAADDMDAALKKYEEAKKERNPEKSLGAAYDDIDHYLVRIMYYKVRALVESGGDPAKAYDEYVKKNIEYAGKVAKVSGVLVGKAFSAKPYQGLDMGTVHATTGDAFVAMGLYHQRKGDPKKAYEEGFSPAAQLYAALQVSTLRSEYVTLYGLPVLRTAANMFTLGEAPNWTMAAEVYKFMGQLQLAIKDMEGERHSQLKGARCRIQLGDVRGAETIYRRAVKEYADTVSAVKAPANDWLTPAKAEYYAAAFAGLGHASYAEKRYFQALENYATAISLFSANTEDRADAVLHAGLATVELAKANNAKAQYYVRSAQSYYFELIKTLGETAAARRAGDLQTAIASIEVKK